MVKQHKQHKQLSFSNEVAAFFPVKYKFDF